MLLHLVSVTLISGNTLHLSYMGAHIASLVVSPSRRIPYLKIANLDSFRHLNLPHLTISTANSPPSVLLNNSNNFNNKPLLAPRACGQILRFVPLRLNSSNIQSVN